MSVFFSCHEIWLQIWFHLKPFRFKSDLSCVSACTHTLLVDDRVLYAHFFPRVHDGHVISDAGRHRECLGKKRRWKILTRETFWNMSKLPIVTKWKDYSNKQTNAMLSAWPRMTTQRGAFFFLPGNLNLLNDRFHKPTPQVRDVLIVVTVVVVVVGGMLC